MLGVLPNVRANPSVKFVPAFGLHGTRRKRRAPYLERYVSQERTTMKLFLTATLLLVAFNANAAEDQHLKLALEFDRLTGTNDKAKLVDSFLPAMLPSDFSAKQKAVLRERLIELMNSEEYRVGKAKAYMSIYSEKELQQLIEFVQLPAYQLLQERRYQTNMELGKAMQSLLAAKAPQLVAKVRGSKEAK